jgi:uncharacterized membrane protein
VLGLVLAGLVAAVVSARANAGLYTDWLWFGSLGLREVWTGLLGTKIALAAIFALLFVVLLVPNLVVVRRWARRGDDREPVDEFVAATRELVERRPFLTLGGVAVLLSLPSRERVRGSGRNGSCSATMSTSASTTLSSARTSGSTCSVCRSSRSSRTGCSGRSWS